MSERMSSSKSSGKRIVAGSGRRSSREAVDDRWGGISSRAGWPLSRLDGGSARGAGAGFEGNAEVAVGSSFPANFNRMRCIATAKSSRVIRPSCSESARSLMGQRSVSTRDMVGGLCTHHIVAMTSLGNFALAKIGTATFERRYPCRDVSSWSKYLSYRALSSGSIFHCVGFVAWEGT